jgi:glycosyltransferase involved in cell wall biosynthesis
LLDDVKREIKKNNLQDRFKLSGWITPEKVLDWLSKSDILFMPSLSEGLPVTGVQALANGLAFVVSDIGGFLDLVDHNKNGFLIDIHDQEKFEKVLKTLITQPEYLLNCRKKSLEKAFYFDISVITKRYQSIFEEVFLGS